MELGKKLGKKCSSPPKREDEDAATALVVQPKREDDDGELNDGDKGDQDSWRRAVI